MKTVAYILLATALTYASCYSLGTMTLRALRVRLYRSEERFLSFVAGSALLSLLVFLLTACGLARKSVFLAATLPVIALAIWKRYDRSAAGEFARIPTRWRIVFWLAFCVFGYLYLANAMLPETSADGINYHVALPARYLREKGFPRITTDMYANLSQGAEMLFLYAFSIGKHTAAAMVEFLFLLALPFGILSYGRRIGAPRAGVAAALLVFASPVVGRTGTIAYVDVAAAAVAFALFYVLQIWRDQRTAQCAALAGLLAGFGYAVKYPLFVGIVYAVGFIAWYSRRDKSRLAQIGIAASMIALMAAPWIIKNTIVVSNPFSPFLNHYFPNPHVYASFEREYVNWFRHMSGVTLGEIPVEAAIRGERLTGLAGPVFLLTPLAMLGLRRRESRHLLLAGAVFAAPYFLNIGTRFLIPALPFAALGMVFVIEEFRAMLPIVLVVHLVLSWPAMIPHYAAKYAWRLERTDWPVALRIRPEPEYIREMLPEYDVGQLLEHLVPPGDVIYSPGFVDHAYHSRNVVVGYQSAFGNRIADILNRAGNRALRPTRRHSFQLSPVTARRVRIEQTKSTAEPATIAEIRLFAAGSELKRDPAWRVRASANPWEVQSAFDNSPVTAWTSGDAVQPGSYIQVDFGTPLKFDRITIDTPYSDWEHAMRIRTEQGDGSWQTIGNAAIEEADWPPRMRRAAMEELKAQGIRWILVKDGDPLSDDLAERATQWGISLAAGINRFRLWHID